jgi:hypothetical protein
VEIGGFDRLALTLLCGTRCTEPQRAVAGRRTWQAAAVLSDGGKNKLILDTCNGICRFARRATIAVIEVFKRIGHEELPNEQTG